MRLIYLFLLFFSRIFFFSQISEQHLEPFFTTFPPLFITYLCVGIVQQCIYNNIRDGHDHIFQLPSCITTCHDNALEYLKIYTRASLIDLLLSLSLCVPPIFRT